MTITESIYIYIFTLFFAFFLFNYADITKVPSDYIKNKLGNKFGYPLKCSMCFAFWITLILYLAGFVPMYYIPVCSSMHLFLDSIYDKISK